jgi:hypothetical protein
VLVPAPLHVSSELGSPGQHTECKHWQDGHGVAQVTKEVAGRLVPGWFGSSLGCP